MMKRKTNLEKQEMPNVVKRQREEWKGRKEDEKGEIEQAQELPEEQKNDGARSVARKAKNCKGEEEAWEEQPSEEEEKRKKEKTRDSS